MDLALLVNKFFEIKIIGQSRKKRNEKLRKMPSNRRNQYNSIEAEKNRKIIGKSFDFYQFL